MSSEVQVQCKSEKPKEKTTMDEELDTKHLREILGFLVPVKKYWRELGLALNLKKETLDEIEINNREVKDFKREMMSKWLNWVDIDYKPTWRRLADALKDPTVEGHESIAKAIEDKYSIN